MRASCLIQSLGTIAVTCGFSHAQVSNPLDSIRDLPDMAVNILSEMNPSVSDPGSWDLQYTGWRAASPDSNVFHYGHASTAMNGWEEYTFPAWSDDPANIDPDFDPHLEQIFNMPELWPALTTLDSQQYAVNYFKLNVSLCIDSGCSQPLPEFLGYDNSNALYIMDTIVESATAPKKIMREATIASGVAGQQIVNTLRAEGKSDAEIDALYPGLLTPSAVYYLTPEVTTNAHLEPIEYIVYDDSENIVVGSELIDFLTSKETPEQIIYEIVNGLPLSPPSDFTATEGGQNGDNPGGSWENIKVKGRYKGGAEASVDIGGNGVKVYGEFELEVEATLGELANGGEDAINAVANTLQAGIDKAVDKARENSESGMSTSTRVAVAGIKVFAWFAGHF
ncbi:MAG: hypothetical protein CMJ25_18230 [Phycisphaerae bacterium]|nr:hypothetical protein [Phycisphaerae bacterium]